MAFVHLHTHSEFSPLDGMVRVWDAFDIARAQGAPALAITDHGNLAGIWAAQKSAERTGVKLIPGMEAYLAIGSRFERDVIWVPADGDEEASDDDERLEKADETHAGMKARPYQHLTLLAVSPAGWRNLVQLNNKAQESIWHKPRIDYALLAEHADGILALTGCVGGPVMGPASRGDWDGARDGIEALTGALGAGNVYVELMEHGNAEESEALPGVVELAREYGLGIVATNDAHYGHAHNEEAHAAWLCVQSKSTLDSPKFVFHGEGFHLRDEAEMRSLRDEEWWQEACDTTLEIAERCAPQSVPGPQDLIPRFPTPDGFADNRAYLRHLLAEGAERIYGEHWLSERDDVKTRVNEEVRIITEAGVVDYFLITHEVRAWARGQGILTGPGRGSGGGSMVAYLLDITRVDPIDNGLLFERFYEPGRTELPDFDLDFPKLSRGEVIEHIQQLYGAQNVAMIGTFAMSRTKKALKQAAAVIGAAALGNRLADAVPNGVNSAQPMAMKYLLDESIPSAAEYRRRLMDGGAIAMRIHDLASAFEDVVAGFSIHASGVIISRENLHDIMPLRKSASRGWVLQWTGPEAEQAGLLKLDVLGLRNLDIIDRAVRYIQETTGEFVDPLALPSPDGTDDERVAAAYRVIAEGRTAGIFQMDGQGMTELAMQLAPRKLDDLSAVIALYRPGPMSAGMHTTFARRVRGEERVSYRDFTTDPSEQERLASVLAETQGVWVFQEQLMRLGTVVAGFDAVQRSKLRKAVSKKKRDEMGIVGAQFLDGAEANGFARRTAELLWDAMLGSAEYLFNKAHSTTYGYLAYMTAFYKANWPAAYAAATLAVTETGKKIKRAQTMRDLTADGIEILPPDINALEAHTHPDGDLAIRFGLAEISDIGSQLANLIVAERTANGPFESLRDLRARTDKPDSNGSAITAGHLRTLIAAGAADAFGPRMGLMAVSGALPVVDLEPPDMEWGVFEASVRQRQALLMPLGQHPLAALADQLREVRLSTPGGNGVFADRRPVGVSRIPDHDGEHADVLGIIASWDERPYSKGRLASVQLEGARETISATVWDNTLTDLRQVGLPAIGDIVIASSKVRYRSIPADPDDPEGEEVVVKTLTINDIVPVDVDSPPTGWWPDVDELELVPELLLEPVVVEPADAKRARPATRPATRPREPQTKPQAPKPEAAPAPAEPVPAPGVTRSGLGDALVASEAVRQASDGIVTHQPQVRLPSQEFQISIWKSGDAAPEATIVFDRLELAAMQAAVGLADAFQARPADFQSEFAQQLQTRLREAHAAGGSIAGVIVRRGGDAALVCSSSVQRALAAGVI